MRLFRRAAVGEDTSKEKGRGDGKIPACINRIIGHDFDSADDDDHEEFDAFDVAAARYCQRVCGYPDRRLCKNQQKV